MQKQRRTSTQGNLRKNSDPNIQNKTRSNSLPPQLTWSNIYPLKKKYLPHNKAYFSLHLRKAKKNKGLFIKNGKQNQINLKEGQDEYLQKKIGNSEKSGKKKLSYFLQQQPKPKVKIIQSPKKCIKDSFQGHRQNKQIQKILRKQQQSKQDCNNGSKFFLVNKQFRITKGFKNQKRNFLKIQNSSRNHSKLSPWAFNQNAQQSFSKVFPEWIIPDI